MEVRLGCKQTEVGVIPNDWDVSTVGQEFSVQLGKMLDAAKNMGVSKPYLGNKAVQWNRIDISDLPTVPMSPSDLDKFRLRKGDLLVCEGGEVGRAAIWDAPLEECYYQKALHRLRPLREFDARLMVAILWQWSKRGILANYATQTSIAHLPRDKFLGVPIPRPPRPEQRAIATALSDVDALLSGLDRLIVKKRDLKQAAMQQLLTGQTRLPGFHEEWEVKRLGEVADIDPENLGSDTPASFAFNYIALEDVDRGSLNGHSEQVFANAPSRARRRLRVHDVLVSTVRPNLQSHLLFRGGVGEWVCSTGFCILRCREVVAKPAYVFAHLFTDSVSRQIDALLTGSNYPAINSGDVGALEIPVPDYAEQTAIAAVLSDMDAELSALEARRDKTRALKQAMMQELLTGKTRLVDSAFQLGEKDAVRTDGRRANIHFKRCVLAAEIVDRLHEEPTFGHVKFEKMIFLVEHLCKVDTGSTYHRDAAGPYDNRAIRSIDSQLRKQKWFDAQKSEGRYRYVPLGNRGKHKEYFERYFSGVRASFERIIDTFRSFDTERCEIVATLFGAWNDLVQQHMPVCDDAILHEVVNNWHESKKRIPKSRWRKALGWMRGHGFVPTEAREKANP